MRRIRGKQQPLIAISLQALRDKFTRTITRTIAHAVALALALATETLTLERKLKAER